MKVYPCQKGVLLFTGLFSLFSAAGSQLAPCINFETPSYIGAPEGVS